jgi:Na+-translocating ferredoxin:NAD+ oxidoreductase RnfG subunit
MSKKIFIIILIAFLFAAFSIPEKIERKADKEIAKYYNTENFSKKVYQIPEDANDLTPSEFGEDNLFKITSEGIVLGYGYIGNAPSKTATFDYLVLFDKNFIITRSKVLLYHEEYGGEIGSRRWLKQFEGLSTTSKTVVYSENIIPISGATISGQSMTRAINDLLMSIKFLQQANQL